MAPPPSFSLLPPSSFFLPPSSFLLPPSSFLLLPSSFSLPFLCAAAVAIVAHTLPFPSLFLSLLLLSLSPLSPSLRFHLHSLSVSFSPFPSDALLTRFCISFLIFTASGTSARARDSLPDFGSFIWQRLGHYSPVPTVQFQSFFFYSPSSSFLTICGRFAPLFIKSIPIRSFSLAFVSI